MTRTGPGVRRIGWTVLLLVALGGMYLFLRAHPGGVSAAVFGVLLAFVVVLVDVVVVGVRRRRHRQGRPSALPLPWFLLRRALDLGLVITIGYGLYAVGTSDGGALRNSGSDGTLSFAGQHTTVSGTVELPAGQSAVWFAVHCVGCYHTNRTHYRDDTKFPAPTRVEVSGSSAPGAVRVEYLGGVRAHTDETDDRFGERDQKQIALLYVASAGTYTVQVQLNRNYYQEPGGTGPLYVDGSYVAPAPKTYDHARVLLGPAPQAFLDTTRLDIMFALLALSALIGLAPRRPQGAGQSSGLPPESPAAPHDELAGA